jgi:hypothetical protein
MRPDAAVWEEGVVEGVGCESGVEVGSTRMRLNVSHSANETSERSVPPVPPPADDRWAPERSKAKTLATCPSSMRETGLVVCRVRFAVNGHDHRGQPSMRLGLVSRLRGTDRKGLYDAVYL